MENEVTGSHPITRDSGRRSAATVVLIGSMVLLATAAFTLSFDALRELALLSGIRPGLTILWPLVVDGCIVAATVSAMSRSGKRSAWYPWTTLILFGGISVAGNALHAQANASSSLDVVIASGVSAVPALALMIVSHLVVQELAIAASEPTRPPSNRAPVPTRTVKPSETAASRPVADSARAEPAPVPVPTPSSALATPAPSAKVVTSSPKGPRVDADSSGAEVERWIREQLAAGVELTGADVAERWGVSAATGRRRLASARTKGPILSVVGK